jgi:hypothetical protein
MAIKCSGCISSLKEIKRLKTEIAASKVEPTWQDIESVGLPKDPDGSDSWEPYLWKTEWKAVYAGRFNNPRNNDYVIIDANDNFLINVADATSWCKIPN